MIKKEELSFDFSAESVGEGHPDKVADYISDSILDAYLEKDPHCRVACETLVKSNCVVLAGEITSNALVDTQAVVRQAIREIGYVYEDNVFHADKVFISNLISTQSSDIAQGVDGKDAEQGAGDQGIMFGYACDETPEYMPAAIMYAHKINQEIARVRHEGTIKWLRPDLKSQVALHYQGGKIAHVKNVVISTQHTPDVSLGVIREFCLNEVIPKVIPENLLRPHTQYFINPTGRFVIGGPEGDAGLTGRKIIVDTYGGGARHGGGAFSGKDPSKVDRSGAYMCRWVAKNIVAAKLAKRVEIQVAYVIGQANISSIAVNTFGTGIYSDLKLSKTINALFSFKPADIIRELTLLSPIYKKTTFYGHFTKNNLPWEQTQKADLIANEITKS